MIDQGYFSKFPAIVYNGQTIPDVTRRVKLSNDLRSIPSNFYPYQIAYDTRADVLAYQYYNDPKLHWLIYLTNGIVDPYYGWYLTNEQLANHIVSKYGTIEDAQRRVKFWRTNWSNDTFNISVAYYDNNITEEISKYYIPNFGQGSNILSYGRRQEDWIVGTNRIISVQLQDASMFAIGNLVDSLDAYPGTGNVIGSGEVINIIGNTIYLKDAQHDFTTAVVKMSDHALGSIFDPSAVQPVKVITQPISDLEGSFWEPVYYYDWEQEQNEINNSILLLEKNFSTEAGFNLQNKLNSPIV